MERAWRKSDQKLYISDNGPEVDDRIARIEPGGHYGWPESMRKNSVLLSEDENSVKSYDEFVTYVGNSPASHAVWPSVQMDYTSQISMEMIRVKILAKHLESCK